MDMLILTVFSKVTNVSNPKQLSFCFGSIIFGIALILNNQQIINLLDGPIYKYSILILVFGVSLLILLLANLKRALKNMKSPKLKTSKSEVV